MQKAKFIAITDVNRNILATFASQKKNSRSIRRETGARQAGSFSPAAGFFYSNIFGHKKIRTGNGSDAKREERVELWV